MIETGAVSVLPPLIAIVLAFITKEVYSSLFIGIFSGMFIYVMASGEPIIAIFTHIFDMMAGKIADNSYMIIFLGLLWSVVELVSRSGGAAAYGRWAAGKFRSPAAAKLASAVLGILVFIDDGFNCLVVGTVMRPIFDRHRISREKLAYIVDATAAPVCIMAPVSSWAVAVASEVSETDGFNIFISTIPYNLYALLTLFMVIFICITDRDFGPMKKAEEVAKAGECEQDKDEEKFPDNGRVIDLVLPIIVLIICAILGMSYVGGFFSGVPFSEAIGVNPTAGLTLGAFAGLVTAFVLYIPRRIMKAGQFIDAIVKGIAGIVHVLLILILSWCLSGVCREMIGTGIFIAGFVGSNTSLLVFLPLLIFVIAALMSFSMGTSWGTFGILIPIVTMICSAPEAAHMLVPALGATLAGSVYGDHCSPLSDTTILASTGAKCRHIDHVETQLPYATLTAAVCAVGYLIVGFSGRPFIALLVSAALLIAAVMFLSGDRRAFAASGKN